MKINSVRTATASALVSIAFLALAGSAFAQNMSAEPLMKDSKGDTVRMNCDQARGMVKGAGGTVLSSGPYRYDLYHVGGTTCSAQKQEMQPAFVCTKDSLLCFIGYTCVEPSAESATK